MPDEERYLHKLTDGRDSERGAALQLTYRQALMKLALIAEREIHEALVQDAIAQEHNDSKNSDE